MSKREPSKTAGRGAARRGESARGRSTKRAPARGEAIVGQERGTESTVSAESDEIHPGPFERAAATATLAHEQIASRAQEIWERRGCPRGEDEKIWLEAEKQLRQETGVS